MQESNMAHLQTLWHVPKATCELASPTGTSMVTKLIANRNITLLLNLGRRFSETSEAEVAGAFPSSCHQVSTTKPIKRFSTQGRQQHTTANAWAQVLPFERVEMGQLQSHLDNWLGRILHGDAGRTFQRWLRIVLVALGIVLVALGALVVLVVVLHR